MRISPAQSPASEDGFVLIEILVSAVVLVIASAGVVALLQTTVRAQGELRHSSEAYALAQEDQARLVSMRLSTLNHLDEVRTVTLNKINFSVRSRGVFINDNTSAPSCGEGTSSADYVEITSVVTWPRMSAPEKAKIVSILSPSNGSLDPNNGTLAISVMNLQQAPIPNVYASGGSGAFAGYADAAGCAVFPDLPAANYTATISGEAAGVVNRNGSFSEQKVVPVVGGDTKTVTFEFDRPGTIPVNFKYRVGASSEFKVATADSVVAYNSGMTAAKAIWTPATIREATVNATPLFPFTSTYLLYPGSCASNNPDPEGKNPGAAAALANVVAPAGGTTAPVTLQLPTLELVVNNSGAALAGAKVTITDKVCKESKGSFVKRIYTSNEAGMPSNSSTGIAELGLPWGSYELCASANISGTDRRKKVSTVNVQSLTGAATATIDLGSGTETGVTCQ
ncbi:MAG: type II secretion system protein [Thermoleophilia bacterium]|nr:type II secretion system protein [Thermoleophilia bacterium]